MNKQQQDKQIIENAPEGAVSVSNWAYRLRSGNLMVLPKGCDCQDNEYYRSLSDIRELVQLRAEVEEKDKRIAEVEIDVIARDLLIQEQDKRIAELAQERDTILETATQAIIGGVTDEKVNVWLAKRDLEQQLKTADSFLKMSQVSGRFGRGAISESDAIRKRNKIHKELEQLRNQAKGGDV
jgi:hypothetical protein